MSYYDYTCLAPNCTKQSTRKWEHTDMPGEWVYTCGTCNMGGSWMLIEYAGSKEHLGQFTPTRDPRPLP